MTNPAPEPDFGITFAGEAWEWFQNFVDGLQGLTVRITPEDGSEEFDAVIVKGNPDAEWATEIIVRRFSEEEAGPVGEPFTVRALTVYVY